MSNRYPDCRGVMMTAANDLAVKRYDAFVMRFMAHGADAAARLKAAMEADPDLLLGHCARGFCFLILGRHELHEDATKALAEARRILAERGGTARECSYVAALATFCDGQWHGAANRLAACLADDPLDGYAAKLVHAIRFMLGDAAGMRRATTDALPAWQESVPGAGYVLGCHAFGLEETGDFREAEAIGRRAVGLARDDAWGFHAVAHVMEMRDRPLDGIDWIDGEAADISATGNLAYHIHWHKALFLLDIKNYDAILTLYDEKIRVQQTDDFRDISNAVSLLMRLEDAGVDVGERWRELTDKAVRRVDDMALAFAALHYLPALIAGDRWTEARSLVAAMRRAGDAKGDQARVFKAVGADLGAAMLAGAERPEYLATHAGRMAECLVNLPMIGGSHAQRDVFVRHVIARLAEARDMARCQALLTDRLDQRPGNIWALDQIARLGIPEVAVNQPAHLVTHAAE